MIDIKKTIYVGPSRRKLRKIEFSISDLRLEDKEWKLSIMLDGFGEDSNVYQVNEHSWIDQLEALSMAFAGIRQCLRAFALKNPEFKLYDLIDDEYREISIEDVFWTHDCVTEEMEDMVFWAAKNGYKPE